MEREWDVNRTKRVQVYLVHKINFLEIDYFHWGLENTTYQWYFMQKKKKKKNPTKFVSANIYFEVFCSKATGCTEDKAIKWQTAVQIKPSSRNILLNGRHKSSQ